VVPFLVVGGLLAVVALGVWQAPRVFRTRPQFIVALPDRRLPFGCKMSWLAVRTQNTAGLISELSLGSIRPVNWVEGVGAIYDDRRSDQCVFVTPPTGEWTLVAGLALPHPLGPAFKDKCSPLLERLSVKFGSAHYYFSFPLLDFYAWARAEDGVMVRAFAVGDEGMVWNRGRLTTAERELKLRFFELRGVENRAGDLGGDLVLMPTEEQVLELAGKWSCNPSRVMEHDVEPTGLGYLGVAPAAWRSERVHRRAAA
jgi:hypothetical protein